MIERRFYPDAAASNAAIAARQPLQGTYTGETKSAYAAAHPPVAKDPAHNPDETPTALRLRADGYDRTAAAHDRTAASIANRPDRAEGYRREATKCRDKAQALRRMADELLGITR